MNSADTPATPTTPATRFDPLRNLEHAAALVADVTGEPLAQVVRGLRRELARPGRTVADDFARRGGPRYEWGPHLEAFYGSSSAFLYELTVWNRNRIKSRMRGWIAHHLARRGGPLDVLCVGDGLGFDCLHLSHRGHRVTYSEVPGPSERFARELFRRCDAAVNVLTDPSAIPAASFDALTCLDVLEHVPDPPAMVRQLAAYLRPGGFLYVSAPFYMLLPWYPTHLRRNRRFSGSLDLYRQAGLRPAGGVMSWYPLVLQKPGTPQATADGPIGRDHSGGMLSVRIGGAIQKIGRFTAWPFLPLHLYRWGCNKSFKE